MKKVLFLLLLTSLAITGFSQVPVALTRSQTSNITGGDTTDLSTQVNYNAGASLAIVVTATRATGTLAGYIRWETSLDNSTWILQSVDTLANSASQSFSKVYVPKTWNYFRARYITTGTNTSSAAGKYVRARTQ